MQVRYRLVLVWYLCGRVWKKSECKPEINEKFSARFHKITRENASRGPPSGAGSPVSGSSQNASPSMSKQVLKMRVKKFMFARQFTEESSSSKETSPIKTPKKLPDNFS